MRITKDELRELVAPVLAQVKAFVEAREAKLLAKIAKADETIASLERRASRHAEHLARLESRVKAVEHGK